MNEILKFKQRKVIPKAQKGLRFVEAGNTTMGNKVWADAITGDLYESNLNPNDSKYISNFKPGIKGHLGKSYNFYNLFSGRGTINGADYVRAAPKDYSFMKGGSRLRTANEEARLKDPEIQAYQQRIQKGTLVDNNAGGQVRGRVGPRINYAANFAGMNFTDEEKKYIADAGFDPTNAKSVQEFILSKAANANLGAHNGVGIADGYWGDKSAAAFQALRNQGIFAPKVDAQPAPVIELPVDAPDFGYATNQDYSNGSQFKNLGFNNYQGLLLYAQNSQDLFAEDLRQRFGNKLTDLNYVESQLGISGKYRGGSAGDFGDMARSMQTWKTEVNNKFDKRRADYALARLAERTGSSGIVYSSPEMKRKFESIKVSPEIRFGGSKFNLNFGNTGASTLGNVGILGENILL